MYIYIYIYICIKDQILAFGSVRRLIRLLGKDHWEPLVQRMLSRLTLV